MAITLQANYAKKLGPPNFSSHQYSVTIRIELTDLGQVEAESARLCWNKARRADGVFADRPGTAGPRTPTSRLPPRGAGRDIRAPCTPLRRGRSFRATCEPGSHPFENSTKTLDPVERVPLLAPLPIFVSPVFVRKLKLSQSPVAVPFFVTF